MAKEWDDDAVKALISESVQIVREDRIDALLRKRLTPPNPNPDDKTDDTGDKGNGNPDNGGDGNKKRKSLWWGETE
jgi:hypothetical protein